MGPQGSVFEGKTLDEAVRKGLESLRLSRAEVMITMLEEGSGGFLGLGARPYKVRIMPRPGGAPREPEPERESSRRGRERGGRDRGGRGRGSRDERAGREVRAQSREGRSERSGERGGGERARRDERDRHEPRERREPREPREPRPAAASPPPVTAAASAGAGDDREEGRRRRRRGRRGGRGRGERETAPSTPLPAETSSAVATLSPVEPPAATHPEPSEPVMNVARSEEPRRESSRREAPQRAPEEGDLSPEQLAAEGKRWTEQLLGAMGFSAQVTARAEGDRVDVTAEVNADEELLTGPKGEVRQALQHLLNRMVNRGAGSRYHLQLEINDFWQHRERELETLARSMADEAVQRNGEVVTEYLNAQERRIIHVTLREDARVKTYALGTGMIKRLAVAPAGFEGGERDEA